MVFDLDQRTASLSVGEFSAFITGPRDAGSGSFAGVWRAQLGTHWHNELRARAIADTPATEFEVPITGRLFHRGWTLTLTGRIDQLLRPPARLPPEVCHLMDDKVPVVLREIKTVTRALPADEADLRAAHPDYFAQLAAYVALSRCRAGSPNPAVAGAAPLLSIRGELVFVEVDSGLSQTVALTPADDTFFRVQLERVTEFLDLRHRARERLRHLAFRPAFATPRAGQETTLADLTATFERHPLVFFEAPTGFGKTGVLLEFALAQLRAGHFDRALYLTSKSTGQLQVVRTLQQMTASPQSNPMGYLPTSASPLSPANGHAPKSNPMGYFSSDAPPSPLSASDADTRLSTLNAPLPSPPASASDSEPSASSPQPSGPITQLSTPNAQRPPLPPPPTTPVAVWHVRNKAEHCVNTTFHCVRESCAYLDSLETRWPASGLARFYLDEKHPRDLDTLRSAGRAARICPYEITRASLAFNDVWIGDYNYVFAPANRGLFFNQPGFDPARTLLLIDEAHNLPSRVADTYSHAFTAADAHAVLSDLHRLRPLAKLVTAWSHWTHALTHLRATDALAPADEDDLRHLLSELARLLPEVPLDYSELDARTAELLWQIPAAHEQLSSSLSALGSQLPTLFWCPRDAELALTCIDAAPAIAATLRDFGGVVLASATLTPTEAFAAACGLDTVTDAQLSTLNSQLPPPPAPDRLGALTKRDTKKLYRQLTSATELLRVEEARDAAAPALLRAHTPWRDGAYDVAVDARIDTTFQHRSRHYATTAATIAALSAAAEVSVNVGRGLPTPPSASAPERSGISRSRPTSAIAVFFPSYAYAETIARHLDGSLPQLSTLDSQLFSLPPLRVALQPRIRDLAAQAAWVEESLALSDALFLVLGSSFAESIDLLGGRISHAMVVGPALPEVNAVQRARMTHHLSGPGSGLSTLNPQLSTKQSAFRRVYQIPGMTKVNQALGRLVRAPGQRARVLLHCKRFLEPSYASLLAPDYQFGANLLTDADLTAWLAAPPM